MALYDKKLNIEKPNGVIQKANLYTDKADVGPDYLTIESGNDIVYAILAANGDIDCSVQVGESVKKVKTTKATDMLHYHRSMTIAEAGFGSIRGFFPDEKCISTEGFSRAIFSEQTHHGGDSNGDFGRVVGENTIFEFHCQEKIYIKTKEYLGHVHYEIFDKNHKLIHESNVYPPSAHQLGYVIFFKLLK